MLRCVFRTPHYAPHTLTSWYYSATPEHVSRLIRYFSDRASMVLEIIDVAQIVTKTAYVFNNLIICFNNVSLLHREFARIFGVDFYSVLSRGSQFKVESFMFRIAKPESFVLLSPSRQDVSLNTYPTVLTSHQYHLCLRLGSKMLQSACH